MDVGGRPDVGVGEDRFEVVGNLELWFGIHCNLGEKRTLLSEVCVPLVGCRRERFGELVEMHIEVLVEVVLCVGCF